LALRRWYLPTKRSSQPPHLGFAAFGHLVAPNQMAQANHSSAGGNNKQFPSVSLKNTDSNRYGGGITSHEIKFEPKAANVCGLQLVDMIAHPSHQALKARSTGVSMKTSFGSRVVEILLRSRYARHPYTRVIDGWGQKLLP